jgi:hypothetical protein
MAERQGRSWTIRASLLGILALGLLGHAARASDTPGSGNLYRAVALVTGTDLRMRATGIAECLRQVLVKVSGEPRLRDDPRVAALAAHPEPLIASYDYADEMAGIPKKDDQGSYDRPHYLTVRFVPERIDAALVELGETPWRGARPAILPVLSVRGFDGASYLLSAESPRAAAQREALASLARDFAMEARFPSEAELKAWRVRPGRLPSPPAETGPGEALVTGTLVFDAKAPGWVGRWRMRWRGRGYAWTISGVNYDAAFRDLVSGAVRIVSGHGAPPREIASHVGGTGLPQAVAR